MGATTYTWIGTSGTIETPSNWIVDGTVAATAPTTGDDVLFAATSSSPYMVVYNGTDSNSANFILDDHNLTLEPGVDQSINRWGGVFINAGTMLVNNPNISWGTANGSSDGLAGEIVIGSGTLIGVMNTQFNGQSYVADLPVPSDASPNDTGTIYFASGGTGQIIAATQSGVAENEQILEIGGTVAAAGATYVNELGNTLTAGAAQFAIQSGATLQFDDTVASTTTITFEGSNAVFDEAELRNISSDSPILPTGITLVGMDVGTENAGHNDGTWSDTIEIGAGSLTATLSSDGTQLTIVADGQTSILNLSGGNYAGDIVNTHTGTGYNGAPSQFVFLDSVCFAQGTLIRTVDGERAVETLVAGDLVAVKEAGRTSFQPVKWIGYRKLTLDDRAIAAGLAPVRIKRGAMAEGLPARDLLVSPPHCMFIDGKLIPAKLLVNDMTIVHETALTSVEYYHIEMDKHSVLIAEGIETESYLDTGNRAFFSNAGLALILHPEFHVNAGLSCWETDACAPLAVSPAAVLPVWRPLADRAVALGYVPPAYATTTEADIHLVADGRRIDAISVARNTYSFMLPAGVNALVLGSRSVVPNKVTRYLDDPRELGVSVSRVVMRGQADRAEFSADHPALAQGWYAAESNDRALWRWTNGQGSLPIGTVAGPVIVEVTVFATSTYIIDETAAEVRFAA